MDKKTGDVTILDTDNKIGDNIANFKSDLQKNNLDNGSTEYSEVAADFIFQADYPRIIQESGIQALQKTGSILMPLSKKQKEGMQK